MVLCLSYLHGVLSWCAICSTLSVAKLVALGGRREDAYLTLQEYFERLNSKESWGKPVAALLGAYKAQKELEIGAIGGKDSMSGTFMDLTVPPTLVSLQLVQLM